MSIITQPMRAFLKVDDRFPGWEVLVAGMLFVGLGLGGMWSVPGEAAPPKQPASERLRTELQFDILYPQERQNGLAAQQWAQIFQELQVPVRIRQPAFNDKIGVTQHTYGTIRQVRVTGQLDRNGMVLFADRKFDTTDVAKLSEWIEELKVYGEQGAPTGQPLWGMKQGEFDLLHAQMKQVVSQPTAGLSMTEAIRALELPSEYPLRFSEGTRELLVERGELPPVPHDLQKMAKGTALALLLRGYELGFSPRRLPDESVVLSIEPLAEIAQAWPIGWDPDTLGLHRLNLAEKMFTAQMIGIEQRTITELIPQIREETGLDLYVDPAAIESRQINLEQLVVNYPRKRTSWSLCLRTIMAQIKLTQEVRVDENDRPFIWVTEYIPRTASRN